MTAAFPPAGLLRINYTPHSSSRSLIACGKTVKQLVLSLINVDDSPHHSPVWTFEICTRCTSRLIESRPESLHGVFFLLHMSRVIIFFELGQAKRHNAHEEIVYRRISKMAAGKRKLAQSRRLWFGWNLQTKHSRHLDIMKMAFVSRMLTIFFFRRMLLLLQSCVALCEWHIP